MSFQGEREQGSRAVRAISIFRNGVNEYKSSIQSAEDYLSSNIFLLPPEIPIARRERIVKIAAVTTIMQRLHCLIMNSDPTPKLIEQSHLVGAVIDPYDGMIDHPKLPTALRFSRELFNAFKEEWSPQNTAGKIDDELLFYNYFLVLRGQIPLKECGGFWHVLKSLHTVQFLSILQRKDAQRQLNQQPTVGELEKISNIKGGLNAILYASLVDPNISDTVNEVDVSEDFTLQRLGELWNICLRDGLMVLFEHGENKLARAIYQAGALVQQIDDFEDVPDDKRSEITTHLNTSPGQSLKFLSRTPKMVRMLKDNFLEAGVNQSYTDKLITYLDLFLARKFIKRLKKLSV